jgi:hypothetical protein
MAYETSATIKFQRTRDHGLTWGSTAVAVSGQYPIIAEANGIQYLISYTSSVGHLMRRSQTFFSTLLPFGAQTSALIVGAGSCNAERLAAIKLEAGGRMIWVAVPSGTTLRHKGSYDDGQTWVSACVVKLYDKGAKYAMAYPGHAHKFTAAKVHKAQRWRCYRVAVSSEQGITSSPDQGLIDAIEYRDLPGGQGGYWSVAHYPDASQTIELTDWSVGAGTWEEIDDPDYTGKLLHQRDSTATSGALTTSVLTSNFTLPANPYIVLNLWRAEPPKDADRITYEPYTRIGFGLDAEEFALVIPYGGEAPFVEYFEPADAKWHRLQSEGGNQLPAVEGITKGQRLWITIRVLLGKLVVSFSRSQNEESGVCYKLPSKEWQFTGVTAYDPTGWTWVDKQPGVKTGPIKVVHNAGQIAVRWWPLYCPTGAQYLWYLGEQESGYTCWNTAAPGVGGGTIPAACQMLAANCDV